MRVMVLVKADKDSEAGVMPSQDLLTKMGNYNEELVKAGVMLAGDGLKPSSQGALVKFTAGKPRVIDGPFAEAKESLAGYWIVDVENEGRALEIASRVVAFTEGPIEVRQVADAPPDL